MIKERDCTRNNYLNIFDFSQVVEVSGQKNPLAKHDHCIIAYITHRFFEVFHVYARFQGEHMHAEYKFRYFDGISYLNVFSSILRCVH